MNNIYYSKANKKAYFGLAFSLIGLVLVYTNNIVYLLVDMFFIVYLYDGILNRDIVVEKDKELYLAIRKNSVLFGSINLTLLMIVFALSVNGLYIISLLLLFLIFIELFVYNLVISYIQMKSINDNKVNEMLKGRSKNYKLYIIDNAEIVDKGKYILYIKTLDNNEEKDSINYAINKYMNDYNKVINLFNDISKRSSNN